MQQEAKDLVGVLRSGALPAPLRKTFETQVGPTMGRDAVQKAKFSMYIGAAAVILFMLIYYRLSGIIANVAMILNLLYMIAILAAFEASLTLPGIAGLVLTIGMAVDANIIIYERIREELRLGKSVRTAVDTGFARAFWTVFDAHVTNFVAGVVLYSYGSGPIRGLRGDVAGRHRHQPLHLLLAVALDVRRRGGAPGRRARHPVDLRTDACRRRTHSKSSSKSSSRARTTSSSAGRSTGSGCRSSWCR